MAEPKTFTAAEQAAAEVMLRHYGSEFTADHLTWRDFADSAREIVAAAEPHLRSEAFEELATAIDGIPQMLVATGADAGRISETYREGIRSAARLARKIGRSDHTTTDQGAP